MIERIYGVLPVFFSVLFLLAAHSWYAEAYYFQRSCLTIAAMLSHVLSIELWVSSLQRVLEAHILSSFPEDHPCNC